MRHIRSGTLRRLLDEPLAVADSEARHVHSCERCRARSERIAADAVTAQGLIGRAAPLPDAGYGWARMQRRPSLAPGDTNELRIPTQRWRLVGSSLGTVTSLTAAGVVLAGVAAAATLTTVFAPTSVAPVPVSAADLQAMTSLLRLGSPSALTATDAASGSRSLPFGTLSWSSAGSARRAGSFAEAEAATGLSVSLPTSLPSGVEQSATYAIFDKVSATVTFGPAAGPSLSGSSLALTVGPAIGVDYGGEGRGATAVGPTGAATASLDGLAPLAIVYMARPLATSTGATTSQLERFLLSQPGVPSDLAQEIRLLGNLQSTLPVPTPSGIATTTTEIDGAPAILLGDGSGIASAAIWEDHGGIVHVVAGLLDQKDLLGVARQVG